ncbi:phage portal protein family protein [Tumebacillus flagellatus]|uniref:Portal protein n=1 Tax=Tumebacillus flagellatus TaxID=1157490 RepID=A0A074LFM6_9BACL|nr:DUF935 family protein [Tumebacillus flagellatus]KEO81046.1 hypothetical protein EL26_22975 [Tumebacillus flagellatus]
MVAPSKVVGQIGNSLWTTFFLFDNAVANPDSALITDFERMYETDETVAAAIDFMILAVLNKLDRYVNESDPTLQEFVNDALNGMRGSLLEACAGILTAIWAGYSGTEIVWKASTWKGSARIMLDKLVTYHPRSVMFNLDRQTGELADEPITQWRWFDGSYVKIPRHKSIVFTHGNGTFGNPYGRSQLKRGRKNWLLKDPVLKMWVNGVDKYGTPLVAAMVPDGEIRDPENPGTEDAPNYISNVAYMSRLLNNIQNGTGLAMSTGTGDEKSDIKFHGAGAGLGDAFERLIMYLNKMLFRSVLTPSLLFDEGQRSGSYALGQSHFDIFTMMNGGIYRKLVEVLIEQLVRPLIEMNFGPQKDYGTFPEREISNEDMDKLAKIFAAMTDKGYLDPEQEEHLHHVQSKLGFPLTKSEDIAARQEKVAKDYGHYLREDETNDQPNDTPVTKETA